MNQPRWETAHPATPPPPELGAAGEHRSAAEQAAQRADYDTALRERYRAVVRGLEQNGLLEVQRARTARETAAAAADRAAAIELPTAAHSFDEVVYGGRPATADEYRYLEQADRYSNAPPPKADLVDATTAAGSGEQRKQRTRRKRLPGLELPELLRDPRLWGVLWAILALVLIGIVLVKVLGAPPPPPPPQIPEPSKPPPPDFGRGQDSILSGMPNWLAYGLIQALIAFAAVVWWRAPRRGALVPEPRPVEVAANEVLAGQAGLYRRSRDRDYAAGQLRAATLRRIRPRLGLPADAPPQQICAAAAQRSGTDPAVVAAALTGPVPDDQALEYVAAQLDWIESTIG
ncbi:DUF4129 domain-containing protein [Nocardia stercoris]|uniref:DUF4129 domain-containing protein n=1 Tax=Nocardia stercoris TaxID=2483361 RepID=A0A3M2L9P3_9NOCA|nr:DUF4129 domain-containing protein [Nocardia stercoris]RMI34134.1 DUF4129 domain-containing protein [Nocardia stercoris]